MSEDLAKAILAARRERAIWDNFFSITIGGVVLALLVACLAVPLQW
jgi:hypothetical protein